MVPDIPFMVTSIEMSRMRILEVLYSNSLALTRVSSYQLLQQQQIRVYNTSMYIHMYKTAKESQTTKDI